MPSTPALTALSLMAPFPFLWPLSPVSLNSLAAAELAISSQVVSMAKNRCLPDSNQCALALGTKDMKSRTSNTMSFNWRKKNPLFILHLPQLRCENHCALHWRACGGSFLALACLPEVRAPNKTAAESVNCVRMHSNNHCLKVQC